MNGIPPLKVASANGFDESDYESFCFRVVGKFGLRLSDYKADQMRRRVGAIAERSGCTNFSNYLALLQKDTQALDVFLNEVTINVTELYRNPNLFKQLMEEILPLVPSSRPDNPFSVWSAGCSYGAEAFTMAMLLHQSAPNRPFRVRGTDIDLTILARASAAKFSQADMASVPKALKDAYFNTMDEATYMPSAKLRNCVSFSRHDLLADPYPEVQYDLILCRNVLIYFTDEAKERIYAGFFRSLKPGGVLFVGGTERLSNHASFGFELIKPFFYQRPLVGRQKLAA